ncbi:unnamed protein product [Moneuplotes crassus]|uniref:Uncharacterized protein n=1 Tax=Euplotes crassus TaxID=5936 RepID=A0AAD1XXK9_EUPCR|nr:unnamed protein product [Moneuplotes crassus]
MGCLCNLAVAAQDLNPDCVGERICECKSSGNAKPGGEHFEIHLDSNSEESWHELNFELFSPQGIKELGEINLTLDCLLCSSEKLLRVSALLLKLNNDCCFNGYDEESVDACTSSHKVFNGCIKRLSCVITLFRSLAASSCCLNCSLFAELFSWYLNCIFFVA